MNEVGERPPQFRRLAREASVSLVSVFHSHSRGRGFGSGYFVVSCAGSLWTQLGVRVREFGPELRQSLFSGSLSSSALANAHCVLRAEEGRSDASTQIGPDCRVATPVACVWGGLRTNSCVLTWQPLVAAVAQVDGRKRNTGAGCGFQPSSPVCPVANVLTIYIYIYTHIHTYRHTYIHAYIYIY